MVIVTAGLLGAVLAACAGGSSVHGVSNPSQSVGVQSGGGAARAAVQVVAAENFWGDVAAQIGGDHVSVTSIIKDPNADPHSYETDPRDAAAISSAAFVILNGAGYDDFASKLLAASPNRSRTVLTVAKVAGVTGNNPNPHLWYDPAYVKDAADAITAALSRADPTDATAFANNERQFLSGYQPYIAELAKIRGKYAGVKIAFTERVPGYLVQAAGLVLGVPSTFAQAVEDGTDPSPGDTATFDADITGHKVRLLLYNGQVTDQATDKIKSLAKSSHVPIVGVDETLPPGEKNFQSWQLHQAQQVFAALGG